MFLQCDAKPCHSYIDVHIHAHGHDHLSVCPSIFRTGEGCIPHTLCSASLGSELYSIKWTSWALDYTGERPNSLPPSIHLNSCLFQQKIVHREIIASLKRMYRVSP